MLLECVNVFMIIAAFSYSHAALCDGNCFCYGGLKYSWKYLSLEMIKKLKMLLSITLRTPYEKYLRIMNHSLQSAQIVHTIARRWERIRNTAIPFVLITKNTSIAKHNV